MKHITRNQFIAQATMGYVLLALGWIFLSDQLLLAFVDVPSLVWLSTVKGIFFVLASSACFTLALRIVPADGLHAPARTREEAAVDALVSHPWPRQLTYAFAFILTVVMFFVRMQMPVDVEERPLLILFVLPVSLAALLGGLGPGLSSTAIASLLCLYFFIPPGKSFAVKANHDLFQWTMLVLDGLIISLTSEALHRFRRREQARRRQFEDVNRALRRSEERFRQVFENALSALPPADRHFAIPAADNRVDQSFGLDIDEFSTFADRQRWICPDPAFRIQPQSRRQKAMARSPHPGYPIVTGEYRTVCTNDSVKTSRIFTCRMSAESFFNIFVRRIDNSRALLCLKTVEGRYTLANPNFQRFLEADEDAIIDKTDADLFGPETTAMIRANDHKALATLSPYSTEEILVIRDRSFTFAVDIFPVFDQQGSIAYLCRVAYDITGRNQLETIGNNLRERQGWSSSFIEHTPAA